MSREELEELAIAYLLGELKDAELQDVERRLQKDASFNRLVEELEASIGVAAMADTDLREPSPDLKGRILEALPNNASDGGQPEVESKAVAAFPVWKTALAVVGWGAAAGLAFVYVGQQQELSELESERDRLSLEKATIEERAEALRSDLASTEARVEALDERAETLSEQVATAIAERAVIEDQLEAAETQLAQARSQRDELETVVAELRRQSALDKVQIASLRSEIDQLQYGVTVWDTAGDRGLMKVYNLPELDTPTQDYQLWVISSEQEAPISAGVFQVDEGGNAEYRFDPGRPISAVEAFAISRERKGGAPAPQGPIVLSGAL